MDMPPINPDWNPELQVELDRLNDEREEAFIANERAQKAAREATQKARAAHKLFVQRTKAFTRVVRQKYLINA